MRITRCGVWIVCLFASGLIGALYADLLYMHMPPMIRTVLGTIGLTGNSHGEAATGAHGGGARVRGANRESQADLDALAIRARAQYSIDWYQRAEPDGAVQGDALFYSPTRAFSDGRIAGREAHGMAIGVNTNGEVLAVAAPQGAGRAGGGGGGMGGGGIGGGAPAAEPETSVFRYTPGEEADTGRTAEGIANVDDAVNPVLAAQIDNSGKVVPSRFTMGGASAEFAQAVAGLQPAASALVGSGRPMRAKTASQSAMAAVTGSEPQSGSALAGRSGLGAHRLGSAAGATKEEAATSLPEVTSLSVAPDENLETLSSVGDSTETEPEPTAVGGLVSALVQKEPEADGNTNTASATGAGTGSDVDLSSLDASLTAVPEPATWILLGAAFAGIAFRRRSSQPAG